MSVKIEISDLGGTSKSDLIKVAKFMLEFAGYSDSVPAAPVAATVPTPPTPPAHVWPEDDGDGVHAPVVPAPPPPPGIEVDAMGMPWDARIHSGSRARVADGSWRQKRNLDPNVLASVEAELKQVMGLPVPADQTSLGLITPVQEIATVQVAPATPFEALVQAVVPPPPFVPNVVPSVAPPTTTPAIASAGVAAVASPSRVEPSNPVTFPALMQKITQAFAAKQLDQATIQSACQQVGLPSLPMLASRPDLVGQVANILGLAL